MQNVVCPMTMVQNDSEMLTKVKNEASAIPVMIPGSASGRTSRKEIASRPKNLKRYRAYATADPRSRAIAVATRPTLTDSSSALRTAGSCHATLNQCREKLEMGQLSTTEPLNA